MVHAHPREAAVDGLNPLQRGLPVMKVLPEQVLVSVPEVVSPSIPRTRARCPQVLQAGQ